MHPAIPIVLVLLITATEMTILNTCTVCDVVEYISPISFNIDDYAETLCPGEELVHIPGTMDCELVQSDKLEIPQ
jgi:hypothetical protein